MIIGETAAETIKSHSATDSCISDSCMKAAYTVVVYGRYNVHIN